MYNCTEEATEMAAKYLLNKKNVCLVTLKISHIDVRTALKKTYICIYIHIYIYIYIYIYIHTPVANVSIHLFADDTTHVQFTLTKT